MKLRVLLILQLLFALVVLGIFITLAASAFWGQYGAYLPPSIPIGSVDVPFTDLALAYGGLLFLLTALVFALLYLFFDRLFIRPIKIITSAMTVFAESNTFTPFPAMSVATSEIRELSNVFVKFTDSVAQLHARDMEMSRIKSDFISTAAHQFRTPLTGIRWALEALQKETLTDFQKTLVDDAVNKSKDLVGIVGMLLDISSIESGKHKYVFEPMPLEELVAQVVNDFKHQSEECKVLLTLHPVPQPFPLVRADRQQIKWVLNNLIENAIRYTPAGGSVEVTVRLEGGRAEVLVRDTGIGITQKDRNNIFERFYRAENAVAKENKGNGLGLYISRTIASDHGGLLDFAPNEGGTGTTFTLALPLAQ